MYLYKYMYMYCMWQEHCVQLTRVCSLVSSQLPGGREGSHTALTLTPVGTQRQAVHKPQQPPLTGGRIGRGRSHKWEGACVLGFVYGQLCVLLERGTALITLEQGNTVCHGN